MKSIIYKGSSLTQYAIIIGLVILALVPIFLIFGNSIIAQFQHLYEGLGNKSVEQTQTNNPSKIAINKNNSAQKQEYTAGELGGSPDSPVKKCIDNECSIDYGEFVLNGIPENMDDFIRSTGTSGGTEELLALLEQVARQLENKGDFAGAAELRDLANLGHFLAQIQSDVENNAKNCESATDPIVCFQNTSEYMTIDTPDNVKQLIPDFQNRMDEYSILRNLRIDEARNRKINSSGSFNTGKTVVPAYAYIDKLDNILANPKFSDLAKELTVELSSSISELTFTHAINYKCLKLVNPDISAGYGGIRKYDIITGDYPMEETYGNSDGLNDVLHPRTSIGTDLDSALICVNGYNKDTGKKCN